MIINIRGTNGSGKTHLVRELLGPDPNLVDLAWYPSPTKTNPDRRRAVEGTVSAASGGWLAVGSYKNACGGLDTVPSFALQQRGVARAWELSIQKTLSINHIVFEGVLCSTVAGSWLEFLQTFPPKIVPPGPVLVAYLDTPIEVCLERIRSRQAASGRGVREIKQWQVEDKVRAIAATRPRFEAAGVRTATIDHRSPRESLLSAMESVR